MTHPTHKPKQSPAAIRQKRYRENKKKELEALKRNTINKPKLSIIEQVDREIEKHTASTEWLKDLRAGMLNII